MHIDFDNNVPIYLQVLEMIKISIISGEIECGERLPSVRELAILYKVNPNTMQKALQELEEIGLIYTERTNGKYVTTNQEIIIRVKNQYAKRLTSDYLEKIAKIGLDKKEIFKYLEGEDD